ncbi:MAG: FKBP-type peptidyl-prolyl cis-trans isomerase [Cyclobacteriaceae bacterium]
MRLTVLIGIVGLFGLSSLWSGCEDPNPVEIFEDSLTFEARLALEEDSIDQFILEQGFDSVFITENGLRIVPFTEGSGEPPNPGDIISIDYTGSFLYGRVFDTTIEEDARAAEIFVDGNDYVPLVRNLGDPSLIRGWNEGVSYMREGQRALLILPSHLAYGEDGFGQIIGPFRIIKFEMGLWRIRRQ